MTTTNIDKVKMINELVLYEMTHSIYESDYDARKEVSDKCKELVAGNTSIESFVSLIQRMGMYKDGKLYDILSYQEVLEACVRIILLL